MKKIIFIILLGVGIFFFYKNNSVKDDAKKREEKKTEIITLTPQKFVKSVMTNGWVEPFKIVEIKCRASGEIIEIPFDVSDNVKKGDLLVKLDPLEEERRVRQYQIRADQSRSNLNNAKFLLEKSIVQLENNKKILKNQVEITKIKYEDLQKKLRRQKALFQKKLVSEEEFENTQTSARIAKYELELAKIKLDDLRSEDIEIERKKEDVARTSSQYEEAVIALELARQNYEYTKVYAPLEGIISEQNIQEGQIVSSGINNVGGGTTMLKICDLSRLYAICSVDESDIGNVKLGQKVKITVDSYDKEIFWGEVERIAVSGKNISNVVTFDVRIEIKSTNKDLLKIEMTVNAEIISEELENAIVVPDEYIDYSKDIPVIKVMKKGKINGVSVEVGNSDGYNTVINRGLNIKDRIVPIKFELKKRNGSGIDRRTARMSMRMAGGGRRGR